jgi:hypothetical protein
MMRRRDAFKASHISFVPYTICVQTVATGGAGLLRWLMPGGINSQAKKGEIIDCMFAQNQVLPSIISKQ